MKKFIYKICKISEWSRAKKKKIFTGTKKDTEDGFIHFSNKSQVRSTLKKYFFNNDNLILIKVDVAKLEKLTYEKSPNDILFPHLYSDLHFNHVKKTYKIILKKDGNHILPPNY